MAAEPYVIVNPKENNVILSVSRTEASGTEKNVALVRPGESYRADLPELVVTMVPLPARLMVDEKGQVRPDTKPGPPRLARRS